MKKRSILILSLFCLFAFSVFAREDDPFAALLKKLAAYTKKYPIEKVHLHLDKQYYAAGDNIWFKAYLVDSRTSTPSEISNVLYVELINPKDSLEKQVILSIKDGTGFGDLQLPISLPEGNYRLRAYTNYMRNAGPAYFFDKTIKIGSSFANSVVVKSSQQIENSGTGEKSVSVIQFSQKNGTPMPKSNIAYEIQLSDKRVIKGKGITNDQGVLSVALPDAVTGGRIVATIIAPDKKKVEKIIPFVAASKNVDVQFFAESGNLVRGFPCRIGIKALNAQGRGEDISGEIIDDEGNKATDFKTSYLGMGSMFLNPMENKSYKAKVKFKDGSEKLFDLPTIEEHGYVLSANQTDSAKIVLKVLTSADLVGKGALKLLVQQNGNVYAVSEIPATKTLTSVTIATAAFPSGTLLITLFNSQNNPVAERMVFVNNTWDKIDIEAKNLKERYEKKQSADLEFVMTNDGMPALGSFSVAVTNTDILGQDLDNESNIFTSLLLTSGLKGYIEKPNHYFLSRDLKTRTELDHLLLTQGWRKFAWKEVEESKLPDSEFKPEKGLQLKGKLTTTSNKPLPNTKVSLITMPVSFFALDTLSDEKGNFVFDRLGYTDSTVFAIKGRVGNSKKDVFIKLENPSSQLITPSHNAGDLTINVNESLNNYLAINDNYLEELQKQGKLNGAIQLDKVEIVAKRPVITKSANYNGPGNADAVIMAEQLVTSVTMSNALLKTVGLFMRGGKAYSLQAPMDMSGQRQPMNIIYDGIMMDKNFTIDDINPATVESIEVLKSPAYTAIYGVVGGDGLIVVTTKFGMDKRRAGDTDFGPALTYMPKGYLIAREFYVPKIEATADEKPDQRSTIYWNPNLNTDPYGKFNFSFNNTNVSGNYRMVIEGLDLSGNIARKVFTFKVD